MRVSLLLAAVCGLSAPAVALAAVPAGSYSGTSVNKEIWVYGAEEPATDKGKATFAVKAGNVVKFKLAGQKFMCGGSAHEVPVTVAKIKLGSTGSGKGTYKNPDVGEFVVSIKVSSSGKATGKITPKNLCRGVVTFTAKKR